MDLYMVGPFEMVRDKLMAKLPPQTDFVPEAMDVAPQKMVTPVGLVVPPTVTRQSQRTLKVPTQGTRPQEKRKRGAFEEKYLYFSELAARKKAVPKVVTTVEVTERKKETK